MSIQGQVLELRVTGCRRLRDTELFSRQDPYVVVEYATTKLRTRTCTDGGRNPSFDEKFHIPLIEGLRELNVLVWNSNTINNDDFIGSCRVPLNKVLTTGHDDTSWPLQTRRMKSAGEVNLIMHLDKNKMGAASPAYGASSASYPAPAGYPAAPPHQAYPTPGHAPYPAPSAYSVPPPQQPYPHHPPQPYGQQYPPQPYGQPQPPQPYGQPYPPQPYGQPYPPPSAAQSPYPPAPYPGAYPPRPY